MYCIVDIETTGGYASAGGITELSIFVHDGKKVIDQFTTLINPEKNIPAYITALTGISPAMVASAPTFKEVAEKVFTLLSNRIFIAHSVNFDHSFIKVHLQQCGYNLQVKKLCTVRLSRKTFPTLPSYSLGNLCRNLNIPLQDRHRAEGDARATVLLFEKILSVNGQVYIDEMLKKNAGDQWLPQLLDKKVVSGLPSTAGVYYFHNTKGKIIYVGKAINIKKRVSSHFTHTDDGQRRQNFLRQIADVSFKECANELHALVLESTEIKRLWPKYNYSQKEPLQKFALYSYQDGLGYLRLAIDKKRKGMAGLCTFNLLNDGLVLIRNLVATYELHSKLCHLDRTPLIPEEYVALDPPPVYNAKVTAALADLATQLPTFAVMDSIKTSKEILCLLMEKGSFWGMGYISSAQKSAPLAILKNELQPFQDNNFIRNSLHAYAAAHPQKKVTFNC